MPQVRGDISCPLRACAQILLNAAKMGLSAIIFRIGQICGAPPVGTWNTTDWVPIVVRSSQALGCLPAHDSVRRSVVLFLSVVDTQIFFRQDVAWITMNTASHSIADVILSVTDHHPNPLLLNLVHPRPVHWNIVFEMIGDALPQKLPLVPLSEWVSRVERASKDSGASNFDKIVSFSRHRKTSCLTVSRSLLSSCSNFCTL